MLAGWPCEVSGRQCKRQKIGKSSVHLHRQASSSRSGSSGLHAHAFSQIPFSSRGQAWIRRLGSSKATRHSGGAVHVSHELRVLDRRHAPLPEATPGIRFDPSTRHPLSGISHRPRPRQWRLRLGPRTFCCTVPKCSSCNFDPQNQALPIQSPTQILPTVARRSVAASQPSDDALTAVARLRHWFLSLLHDS